MHLLTNLQGALVTRFMFEDSSLCFINCHLAAGQTHTAHRNNDVATILEAESLPTERDPDIRASLYVGGGDGTQILDHEVCIMNGDLNYRIDAIPRNTVVDMIKRNEFSKLLERDQIMVSRRRVSGFRLSPFVEAPITFAPTYKYDVGTDNYDSSEKKRSPAWCDRLLYRGPGRIKQIEYRRHEVKVSDHRPVSGTFKIRVKTIDSNEREKAKEKCYKAFREVQYRLATEAR
jgi:endonuclease/exonuclease/phosphatase family metal-dependent hydrolase